MTDPSPLRKRIAHAIHRYDNHHALSGNDILSKHHLGEADAVLAELKPELDALADYENRITWHTTCQSCARVLDSRIRETERAERAEAALARVRAYVDQLDGMGNGTDIEADSLRHAIATNLRATLDEPGPITDAAGRTVCTCTYDFRCGCGTSANYRPPQLAPAPAATQATEPREHCGALSPETQLTSPRTECVLRPGHQGSHADHVGCRWWYDPGTKSSCTCGAPTGDDEEATEVRNGWIHSRSCAAVKGALGA
ncbi:hypothetical protein [Streptomyces sp. NPDC052015]|uniref:hypothetical protein n=1 Tax=Streptomyces sp. NPDC052015 TaxID=3154755 RepID=UPI00341735E4